MKVTKLKIDYFRHIHDQTIEFGDKLTVITGQNGTGKSSLLGWVAQACAFKSDIKTITGKPYKSKYSEIFRFSKDDDFSNKYMVSLVYKNDVDAAENVKQMSTRHLKKTESGNERYKVDFDRNIKDSNQRALDFPVLYLGLKRLIPLATERSISQNEIRLDSEEINLFSRLSKKILILLDQNITSEGIRSPNKNILAMKTDRYGHLGNSAGQDNIGQIISAFISFRRLKNLQRDSYKGGLLLIDEIDATLYAGSQIHLIQEMYKFSRDHNLQIIFTTHSLEILEYLSDKGGDDTKINYLEQKDGRIINKINPPIKFLANKIKVQTGQEDKIQKLQVICEDDVSEVWCKNLLNGVDYKKYLSIVKGPFGNGELSKMSESNHPIFSNALFVLDGDCREKYKNIRMPDRTIFLPSNRPPEVVFYNFLNGLSDDDPFWIENDSLNYSKQTCFQNYQDSNLSIVKQWFSDSELKDLFGRGYSKLMNRWKKGNLESVQEFKNDFEKIFENIDRSSF